MVGFNDGPRHQQPGIKPLSPLENKAVHARVAHIAAAEGLTLQPGALEAVAEVAEGDMRKAITTLQSAATLHGKTVDAAAVHAVSSAVPREALGPLLQLLRSKNSLDKAQMAACGLLKDGYPAQQLLRQVADAVLHAEATSDVQKAHICTCLAQADKALVDGADEVLQVKYRITCTLFAALDGGLPVLLDHGLAFSGLWIYLLCHHVKVTLDCPTASPCGRRPS